MSGPVNNVCKECLREKLDETMKDTDTSKKNATFRVAPYRLNRSKNSNIYCHTQPAKENKQKRLWKETEIFAAINFFLNASFIRR